MNLPSGWYGVHINPIQWAIGPVSVGKRPKGGYYPIVGRNVELHEYKMAVADLLGNVDKLPEGDYEIEFFFWRQITSTTVKRDNYVDTTNLQKATEDALQGVLFENDRNVRKVTSTLVEQGPEVKPFVAMRVEMWGGFNPTDLPVEVWRMILADPEPVADNNVWRGPNA